MSKELVCYQKLYGEMMRSNTLCVPAAAVYLGCALFPNFKAPNNINELESIFKKFIDKRGHVTKPNDYLSIIRVCGLEPSKYLTFLKGYDPLLRVPVEYTTKDVRQVLGETPHGLIDLRLEVSTIPNHVTPWLRHDPFCYEEFEVVAHKDKRTRLYPMGVLVLT